MGVRVRVQGKIRLEMLMVLGNLVVMLLRRKI